MKIYRIAKWQALSPVYHGTVYEFNPENINRNKILFFSDSQSFAHDYASQKSFEAKMDANIAVFAYSIKGNLFDPQCKQDVDSVMPYLPEKITVYNDFGMDSQLTLEEWRQMITGEYTEQPFWSPQDLEGKKVGDFLPDNDVYSKPLSYQLVEITPDKVYFLNNRFVSEILNGMYTFNFNNDREKNMSKTKEEVINDLKTLKENEFIKKYKLFNDLRYFPRIYYKSRHPVTTQNNSMWRWLEGDGVFEAIQQAGFDIVKSRERNATTYAAFPSAEVILLK